MDEALQALQQELSDANRPVPNEVENALFQARTFAISKQEFLLNLPSGLRFHYRRGAGVCSERPTDVGDQEFELFRSGTLAGAVAMLNDMTVLHVSAVEYAGGVFAFTASSGGGKSTLAAGLQEYGFTDYCDDTLLVRNTAEGLMSAPSQHLIKLWGDALELTGRPRGDRIRSGTNKFFIANQSVTPRLPKPLKALYVLRFAKDGTTAIEAVTGTRTLEMVQAALYRPHIVEALWPKATAFEKLAAIGTACPIFQFERPRDRESYWHGVETIAEHIRTQTAI